MEVSLLKASRIYPDCLAMVKKLRAMTYNAEEQVRAQKNQTAFLLQLAGRTTPKGLHCLSMRLTSEYFSLQSGERELPNQDKVHDPNLFHFAVFSDNILACAVVINSTVSAATVSCHAFQFGFGDIILSVVDIFNVHFLSRAHSHPSVTYTNAEHSAIGETHQIL